MKFDPDCVRDILIAAEERTDGMSLEWDIPGPAEAKAVDGLAAYPYGVAVYHIMQCESGGLIKVGNRWITGGFTVADLTPQGHQTLAQLRLPKALQLWTKSKETGILSSVESMVSWGLGIAEMILK